MGHDDDKPLQHLGGSPPVAVGVETFGEGEPQPQPQFTVDLELYGTETRGDDSAAYYASLPEDEQANFLVQYDMTKPATDKGQCEVPQDGFHVKQVDFVRPFKVIGEIQKPGELKITGEAKYTADAERSGTWKITQPYERTGHDDIVTPVTELGHLETKQQVKVDKVVYGEKQIIEGQVIKGQPGATTWDWDTQDFKPTGPMVGKCGTATCGMKDKGPKEYTEEKTCDNLVIENVELKVNSLQEVEHKDFKQYKLHVDDSIPRLCQNTLPKGLLKAMAAKNIGIESLFKADVNFNVVKTEDITACEVQTIAKQDFELKYDEKHTLKWKQPISKECTKEWTQDGIEYGKGTYEQTDQADITGYYIQPGAELGQINTYIRQHNEDRQKGEEKTTQHEKTEEKPVGDAKYVVEKTNDWHREGEIRPDTVTFHEEYNAKGEIVYKPTGIIELDVKYKSVFQKCPLLRISQNNVCKLTDEQKAAFKGHLASNEIQCIDKAADVLVAGKCVIGSDGKYEPAELENGVHYKSAEDVVDETDTSAKGIFEVLKARFEKVVIEALERSERGQEIERAMQRVNAEAAKVNEQVQAETLKEGGPDAAKLAQLEAKQRAFPERIAKLEAERGEVERLSQKAAEELRAIREDAVERAAELGMGFEEAEQIMERAAANVRTKYEDVQRQVQQAELAAEEAARATADKTVDDCGDKPDEPTPGPEPNDVDDPKPDKCHAAEKEAAYKAIANDDYGSQLGYILLRTVQDSYNYSGEQATWKALFAIKDTVTADDLVTATEYSSFPVSLEQAEAALMLYDGQEFQGVQYWAAGDRDGYLENDEYVNCGRNRNVNVDRLLDTEPLVEEEGAADSLSANGDVELAEDALEADLAAAARLDAIDELAADDA
eukprot:tig00021435_g21387.t1